MKKPALVIMIGCFAMLAAGASAIMTPSDYVNGFGGDFNSYTRILSLTDCDLLQQEFDQLESECTEKINGSPATRSLVGYMLAIADRLEEMNCHNSAGPASARAAQARTQSAERSPTASKL